MGSLKSNVTDVPTKGWRATRVCVLRSKVITAHNNKQAMPKLGKMTASGWPGQVYDLYPQNCEK